MWPFRTYERLGVKYAFGTDSPVVGIDSMNVIYDAVTRQSPADGSPKGGWQPQEDHRGPGPARLHPRQRHGRRPPFGARHHRAGQAGGPCGAGQKPFGRAPQEILSARVVMTLVGGEIVYQAD